MKKDISLDLIEVAFDWMRDLIEDYCCREGIERDSLAKEISGNMSDEAYNTFYDYLLKGGAQLPDSLCLGLKDYLAKRNMDLDEIAGRPTSEYDEKCITSEERNAIMGWMDENFGRHKFEQDFRHTYEKLKETHKMEEENYD